MPARAPEIAAAPSIVRLTFIPACRAANTFSPTARNLKPQTDLANINCAIKAQTIAITKPECTRILSIKGGNIP